MPELLTDLNRALSQSPQTPIATLLASARRQLGFADHIAAGMDEGSRTAKPAVASGFLRLADAAPALATDQARGYELAATARPAGTTQTLSLQVMEASRTMRAGARLVSVADAPEPVQSTNPSAPPALYERVSRFTTIERATFSPVADGSDVTVSPLPIKTAQINIGDAPSHALRFEITRAQQKAKTDAELEFEISRSLVLGLGALCDKVLLSAIAASTPANFTLALAAARGIRFAELQAIVGTAGTAAAVGQDGALRANGIPAELSDQAAATVIGAWSRCGVAVNELVQIHFERRNVTGLLAVTAFVNAHALLPAPEFFWLAA